MGKRGDWPLRGDGDGPVSSTKNVPGRFADQLVMAASDPFCGVWVWQSGPYSRGACGDLRAAAEVGHKAIGRISDLQATVCDRQHADLVCDHIFLSLCDLVCAARTFFLAHAGVAEDPSRLPGYAEKSAGVFFCRMRIVPVCSAFDGEHEGAGKHTDGGVVQVPADGDDVCGHGGVCRAAGGGDAFPRISLPDVRALVRSGAGDLADGRAIWIDACGSARLDVGPGGDADDGGNRFYAGASADRNCVREFSDAFGVQLADFGRRRFKYALVYENAHRQVANSLPSPHSLK